MNNKEKHEAIEKIGAKMGTLYGEAFRLFSEDIDAMAQFIAVTTVVATVNTGTCPHCVMQALEKDFAAMNMEEDMMRMDS